MRVIILSERARVGGRAGKNESEKKEEKIERSKVREGGKKHFQMPL